MSENEIDNKKSKLGLDARLKELAKLYPIVTITMDNETLASEVAAEIGKAGFHVIAQPKQHASTLIRTLTKAMNRNYLSLVHFKSQMGSSNLISLLRAIKSRSPSISFKNLVPIFFSKPTYYDQFLVFKNLAAFGIEYAIFLSPNAPSKKIIQEIVAELSRFSFEGISLIERAADIAIDVKGINLEDVEKYKDAIMKGERAIVEGKHEEAIQFLTKAISIKPSIQNLLNRGDAF
jgi:hypothetical protein